MADWEIDIQLPGGGVLAGALGDSDQPTVFNTGQVIFGWVRAFEEEQDERYRQTPPCAPPPGCATSWTTTAAGVSSARR